MKNKEIAVLVEKVQNQKANSYEELYREIWDTVYYYCYKSLGNEQDAKDAMQTVFLKLYNKFDTLHHPNVFNKFLYTVMRYTCADFNRSKFRDDTDDLETYDSVTEDNAEFLPSEAYERQDIRREIAQMIEALPEKQREAILLFYYEGLSTKEIAEITDSQLGAVKNRLATARKSLRERAEALVKKGSLDYSMGAAPILTSILLEEAQLIASPEIGDLAWQGICASLGLAGAAAGIGAAGASTSATATTATTAATAATSGIVTNVVIGLTCLAMLATGGYFVHYLNHNIINPPAIIAEDDSLSIESRINAITNRTEFMALVEEFGFVFLGGVWGSDTGDQMLYYIEEADRFIYLGYTTGLQNQFRVVYEVTAERLPLTDEQIDEWFERN